ncbi:MAG: hypothetical protein O7B99_06970 [Planctomycetota bacterium]|nr:hypothetical protein [Planctomycetota bacterium]
MPPVPETTEEPTVKAIVGLIFSVLAFAWCPCVGSILGIVLGAGEKSGVARAAVIVGWIGVAYILFAILVTLALLFLVGH